MKRTLLSGLLAALMLSSAGCAVLRVEADTSKPVLLNNPDKIPTSRHFEVNGSQWYFLWALVGNDNKAINDAILGQLGRKGGIVNLQVHVENSFTDQLIAVLTLGIAAPRSFTVSGDLID